MRYKLLKKYNSPIKGSIKAGAIKEDSEWITIFGLGETTPNFLPDWFALVEPVTLATVIGATIEDVKKVLSVLSEAGIKIEYRDLRSEITAITLAANTQ